MNTAKWQYWLTGAGSGEDNGQDIGDRPPPTDAAFDVVEDVPVCKKFKVVGQPCDDDCECMGGMCLLNEYAPFRFCSKKCGDSVPGNPCAPETEGATWTSLCVEFPSGWLIQPAQFCAPLCSEMLDCQKTGAPWETCEPPHWKGNPLYSASGDKVCISPSAQGHEPINPDTCEGWEQLFNEWPQERLACLGFCEFLKACQEMPEDLSTTCCGFKCTSRMITNGIVDKDYFQYIHYYFDNYQAFSGTALVCTKPFEACGEEVEIP